MPTQRSTKERVRGMAASRSGSRSLRKRLFRCAAGRSWIGANQERDVVPWLSVSLRLRGVLLRVSQPGGGFTRRAAKERRRV